MNRLRPRVYEAMMAWHLKRYRQMVFLTGPRQVGKTTTSRGLGSVCLNWDDMGDRETILAGTSALAGKLGLAGIRRAPVVAVLDEIHKWGKWQGFLKGFFDTYGDRVRLIVTGSSRMDVYRRGGDSMMGRYFLYHMHPFSVGEIARQDSPDTPVRPPMKVSEVEFKSLWEHGGYPEPFLRRDRRFDVRWRSMRRQQLLRADIRDLTRLQELSQIEVLVDLLNTRSATTLVLSHLAGTIRTSVDTVGRWVTTLASLHHGFLVRPWHRRISRSLVKEPKWYLRDWSGVKDPGARAETFLACHLLKAVEGWTDLGLGDFALHYLRDKEGREVDFAVIRDGKPWFLVETKMSEDGLNPALLHFQRLTGATNAFQAVVNAPFVEADCFKRKDPVIVPARTLLSQLL